ncbi:MAG: hypothetical protein FWE25_03410 [Lachnospiraceae bacterium]|nr:hypothetical protein [Lachnospiraceae bacterium]
MITFAERLEIAKDERSSQRNEIFRRAMALDRRPNSDSLSEYEKGYRSAILDVLEMVRGLEE